MVRVTLQGREEKGHICMYTFLLFMVVSDLLRYDFSEV